MSNAVARQKIVQYVGSGDERYASLEEFCDAILLTEDGYALKVHRVILSKKSIYFQKLFLFGGPQKSDTEYLISLFSGQAVSHVLQYLYSGKVYLDAVNIVEMLLASNYFLLDELNLKCQIFAKKHLSLTNSLNTFIVSHMTNQLELYRYSRGFICVNFPNILDMHANDIFDIPFDIFKNLLEDDSLNVPDERYIWRAVEEWVGNSSDRLSSVQELFSTLRFCNLNNHLLQYLQKSDILRNNPSLQELNDILVATKLPELGMKFERFLSLKYSIAASKIPRQPKRLYLIAKVTDTERELYITYNEDFYIRRKITFEVNLPFQPNLMVIVGNFIYIFKKDSKTVNVFNILDRTYNDIYELQSSIRYIFHKNDFLYVSGYQNFYTSDGDISRLTGLFERYDLRNKTFEDLGSTPNIVSAAMMGNKIYFHCEKQIPMMYLSMTIEEYDVLSKSKSIISSPPECSRLLRGLYVRQMFASDDQLFVIAYEEELLNIVEVYRTETGVWEKVQSLPNGLQDFGSRILDGKLVIFDEYDPNWSPVYWNKTAEVWTPFQSKDFQLLKTHWFYPIEDYDTITRLMNENRSHVHQWEYFDEIF